MTLIVAFYLPLSSMLRKQPQQTAQCYAAPQTEMWESKKLVQLLFVPNSINLNMLLVWKKPNRLEQIQSLSNATDYGSASGAIVESAKRT